VLDGFAVHAADLSFRHDSEKIDRFDIPWPAFRQTGKPLTLVIRIPYAEGGLGSTPDHLKAVEKVIGQLLASGRAANVPCREVQIDYDCPESKLELYAGFFDKLHAIRPDLFVTFTALPSWLKSTAFLALIQSASRYVLQVHSLQLPKNGDTAAVICDVPAARQAVARASQLAVPFRVALPTYSCTVILNAQGERVDVVSEGNPGAQGITGRSDPVALAGLVAELQEHRPPGLEGIIWYRLPVESDRMNWSWPTFRAVLAGRAPLSQLEVSLVPHAEGYVTLELRNAGEKAEPLPRSLVVQWSGGTYASGDALGGYHLTPSETSCRFTADQPKRPEIAPGQTFVAGWLRITDPRDLKAALE